jgi:hypothetical protein
MILDMQVELRELHQLERRVTDYLAKK